jgi:hypothetical protein
LTVLLGLPGVGKSALAQTLASDQKIRKQFADGVLWMSLGPDPDVARLLARWGKLLGLPVTEMAESTKEMWTEALRSIISERSFLFIIDDAWTLPDVLSFCVGGAKSSYLITTRWPNVAAGVSVHGVVEVEELNMEDSVNLLRRLAPTVVEEYETALRGLVQTVGGLPLALESLGHYLRKESYRAPARRVIAALERLGNIQERLQLGGTRLPRESDRSLSDEIEASDQRLGSEARQAFYALSVLPAKPESFSEEAALAVAGCSALVLDELLDAGLLEYRQTGRYLLHPVLADYARQHLQGSSAYERLIAYALNMQPDLFEKERSTVIAAVEAASALGKERELEDLSRKK